MDDILTDLEALPKIVSGTPCTIQRMRGQEPELAKNWDAVVRKLRSEPGWRTHGQVVTWFKSKGWNIDEQSVGRHIRGLCRKCPTIE